MRKASAYETWVRAQGIPLVEGHGVTDVATLDVAPWSLMGGSGTVIKLVGMEGLTGMFVLELGPGEQLEPIRHLFEKLTYVLSGTVELEVWGPGGDTAGQVTLDARSLAAVPLNAVHRFRNASASRPARMLCFSNAPMVMDVFQDPGFVFRCDHHFADRFPSDRALFAPGARELHTPENVWLWDTDVVVDVPNVGVDLEEKKGKGVRLTQCEMAGGILVTHMADWPVASYHKAHYHGGGATLLIVRGEGYTLMWPQWAGVRPYEAGNAEAVVRVDWQVGSVMSPPDGWFHQHFNVSPHAARQLAFRYGSRRRGVEFHDLRKAGGVYKSIKEGGTIIDYEDEDPAIREIFEEACAGAAV